MKRNLLASLIVSIACASSFAVVGEVVTGALKTNVRCELKCYPYNDDSCLTIATNEAIDTCEAEGLEHCKVTEFRESIKTGTRSCRWGFYSLIQYKGIRPR